MEAAPARSACRRGSSRRSQLPGRRLRALLSATATMTRSTASAGGARVRLRCRRAPRAARPRSRRPPAGARARPGRRPSARHAACGNVSWTAGDLQPGQSTGQQKRSLAPSSARGHAESGHMRHFMMQRITCSCRTCGAVHPQGRAGDSVSRVGGDHRGKAVAPADSRDKLDRGRPPASWRVIRKDHRTQEPWGGERLAGFQIFRSRRGRPDAWSASCRAVP